MNMPAKCGHKARRSESKSVSLINKYRVHPNGVAKALFVFCPWRSDRVALITSIYTFTTTRVVECGIVSMSIDGTSYTPDLTSKY